MWKRNVEWLSVLDRSRRGEGVRRMVKKWGWGEDDEPRTKTVLRHPSLSFSVQNLEPNDHRP